MEFQSSVKSYAYRIADFAMDNTNPVKERYYRRDEDVNDPNAGIDLVVQHDANLRHIDNDVYFPNCVVDITATINRDRSWRFLHIFVRAKSEYEYRLFASYKDAIKYELCEYLQTEDVSFEVALDSDKEKEENNENN